MLLGSGVVVLGLLLFGMLAPEPAVAPPNSYFINRTNYCSMSNLLPTRPEPLVLCHQFNEHSCCTPPNDLDLLQAWTAIVELGDGCSYSKHEVKAAFKELREFTCIGCDPNEPTYRFQTKYGDRHLPGGQNPPHPELPEDDFTWRVCRSWLYGADGQSGLWGKNGSKFNRCGIQMLTDCSAVKQVSYNPLNDTWMTSDVPILEGWDPGMCAGSPVIPSVEFGDDSEPAASLLLATIPLGQMFNAFQFVVTDDLAPSFRYNWTPCFRGGSPAQALFVAFLVAAVGACLSLLS